MILYKNNPDISERNNIVGYEYLIESDNLFISITAVNDIVHSIEIENMDFWSTTERKEIQETLMECYEVIAFAEDIRAVVGQKIYMIENEVYQYSGTKKTL